MGSDAGDIGDPELVWSIHIALFVQRIVCHDDGAATVRAGAVFCNQSGPLCPPNLLAQNRPASAVNPMSLNRKGAEGGRYSLRQSEPDRHKL